jgi:hypothetical protein
MNQIPAKFIFEIQADCIFTAYKHIYINYNHLSARALINISDYILILRQKKRTFVPALQKRY